MNESEVPEPEPEPDLTLHIEVSILSGRRTPLAVQPTDTVERVKHIDMLCAEVGVPPLEQRLLFNANELADTSTMEQNGVVDGSTFHLVLRLVVAGSAAKGELGQGLDQQRWCWPGHPIDCMPINFFKIFIKNDFYKSTLLVHNWYKSQNTQ